MLQWLLPLLANDSDTDVVKVLSQPDKLGCTPLHLAASEGKTEMCSFIVGRGVDVAAKTKDGKTAFDVAEEMGFAETMSCLGSGEDAQPMAKRLKKDSSAN